VVVIVVVVVVVIVIMSLKLSYQQYFSAVSSPFTNILIVDHRMSSNWKKLLKSGRFDVGKQNKKKHFKSKKRKKSNMM